jgi:hypothetical protein
VRKTLAALVAAAAAAVPVAGCVAAPPNPQLFTGEFHTFGERLSDGYMWQAQKGPLQDGSYLDGRCMVPVVANGPTQKAVDKGCVVVLRTGGKAYRLTGKSTYDLVSGTFRTADGKYVLTIRAYFVKANGLQNDVLLDLSLKH